MIKSRQLYTRQVSFSNGRILAVALSMALGSALCFADNTNTVVPIAPGDVPGLLNQCASLAHLSSNPEHDTPPKARALVFKTYGECVADVKRAYQKWVDTQDVAASTAASTVNATLNALPDLPPEAKRALVQAGAGAAPAVSPAAVHSADAQITDATNKAATGTQQTASAENFLGLSWGVGAGYAFGQGPKRVTASVVNDIVRISSDVTDGPRVFFEAHYYPETLTGNTGDFGWGPFATVEAGTSSGSSSNAIGGFGIGVMGGWRTDGSNGFSLGIGYVWEGNVQTLGDGIQANQPLPNGETQIRYKNRSAGALMVVLSRQFGTSSSNKTSTAPDSK